MDKEKIIKQGENIDKGIDFYLWNGYFDNSFPWIFDIKKIEINELVSTYRSEEKTGIKNNKTKPISFLENYNNRLRFKSVQNIFSYFNFFIYLKKNKNELLLFYKDKGIMANDETFNTLNFRNRFPLFSYSGNVGFPINIRVSNYEWIKKNIYKAQEHQNNENKCEITLDIIDFYNSIYTHKILKFNKMYNSGKLKNKNELKEIIEDIRSQDSKFDKSITKGKNNETNGILIGPSNSLIFSEILLNQISIILEKNNFFHERSYDQFKFLFLSEEEYNKNQFDIIKIFKGFGLNIKEKNCNYLQKNLELKNNLTNVFNENNSLEDIFSSFIETLGKSKKEYNISLFCVDFYNELKNKRENAKNEIIKYSLFKEIIKKILETPQLSNNFYLIFSFFLKSCSISQKEEYINLLFNDLELKDIFEKAVVNKKRTVSIWWLFMKIDLYKETNTKIDPQILIDEFWFVEEHDSENYLYLSLFLNIFLNQYKYDYLFPPDTSGDIAEWVTQFFNKNVLQEISILPIIEKEAEETLKILKENKQDSVFFFDIEEKLEKIQDISKKRNNNVNESSILYNEKFMLLYTIINSDFNNQIVSPEKKEFENSKKYELIKILINENFSFFNDDYINKLELNQYGN